MNNDIEVEDKTVRCKGECDSEREHLEEEKVVLESRYKQAEEEKKRLEAERDQLMEEHLRLQKKFDDMKSEIRTLAKSKNIGRNDPCLCGSGKKYKKCCGA